MQTAPGFDNWPSLNCHVLKILGKKQDKDKLQS